VFSSESFIAYKLNKEMNGLCNENYKTLLNNKITTTGNTSPVQGLKDLKLFKVSLL
jgi:hypothetical protein